MTEASSRLARYALLPVAALQVLAGYLPRALGWGVPIGDRATAGGIPPELPPGPFFAIWGVIFTLYLAFAIYALRRDSTLAQSLAGPLVLVGLLNTAWMVSTQAIGHPVLDALLIAPILAATWRGAWSFDRLRDSVSGLERHLGESLTGLLAGWLTVATAISLPRAGRHVLGQGPTDSEWIAFWSVIAAVSIATWWFKNRISRSWWFYAAAGWGLTGIIVNNWTRTGFGYFGWITLAFIAWLIFRRLMQGAQGARGGRGASSASPMTRGMSG